MLLKDGLSRIEFRDRRPPIVDLTRRRFIPMDLWMPGGAEGGSAEGSPLTESCKKGKPLSVSTGSRRKKKPWTTGMAGHQCHFLPTFLTGKRVF